MNHFDINELLLLDAPVRQRFIAMSANAGNFPKQHLDTMLRFSGDLSVVEKTLADNGIFNNECSDATTIKFNEKKKTLFYQRLQTAIDRTNQF